MSQYCLPDDIIRVEVPGRILRDTRRSAILGGRFLVAADEPDVKETTSHAPARQTVVSKQILHHGDVVELGARLEGAFDFVDNVESTWKEYVSPHSSEGRAPAACVECFSALAFVGDSLDDELVAVEMPRIH